MQLNEVGEISLETSASLFIIVVCVKLLRLKCHSRSACCHETVEVDLENPGVNNNINVI